MATRELEEVGEGSVAFYVFGEEIGDVVPDRPWCCDYEEVE
jgi:hypothetical protein